MRRHWTARAIRLVLAGIILGPASGYAQATPPAPCEAERLPPYPALDQAPLVTFWNEAAFGRDWRPPECTGWTEQGFSTLVTVAARFRYTAGAEGLLRRAGAASELVGMRYWSTTHKKWQALIVNAHAVSGAPPNRHRPDFLPHEMSESKILYLEQVDNLSGSATYRMHMQKVSADRIVFDIQNVSVMRYFLVTLFRPGEMQSVYFLDREPDDVWRYYSITRMARNASRLAAGHEASSINRAVAFYRFLAGIPTDQEPPAAR